MAQSRYDRAPVPDALAAERTPLAAELMLLAYARRAFAMFVTGVTGGQLLEDPLLVLLAHSLAVLGLFVFVFGLVRYRASRRETRRLLERLRSAERDR